MRKTRRLLLRHACSALAAPFALGALAAGATALAIPGAAARAATTRRPAAGKPSHYAAHPELDRFVQRMIELHGFDDASLRRTFGGVRRNAQVLRLIAPPASGFRRSWHAYRARFVEPLRIREGGEFWQANEATLARATRAFGVPAEFIVSIIGVETIYGRITGEFRVIDALATLAFDYPRRAEYFRGELEQFLLLARENSIDPFSVLGSYAGAIGLPQFMPGSIRRYAVDFDGDGRIDLRQSATDAIGSVARFLAEHGWVRGEATHFGARIAPYARLDALLEAGIEPRFTAAELAAHGVSASEPLPEGMRVALIDLDTEGSPTVYALGARNFYVITRYNRSSFYAMAVIELARTLKLEHEVRR
ncbi:MAG: lytic murein transglycosylase B [Burkholderiaceae bacterium]|nr:lytic murein transglycosylase B [Burkholderiaceae bacterium]